jgi:hypothetical protein
MPAEIRDPFAAGLAEAKKRIRLRAVCNPRAWLERPTNRGIMPLYF